MKKLRIIAKGTILVNKTKNKLGGEEQRRLLENLIQSNSRQSQMINQKNRQTIRNLLSGAPTTIRLRELDWKLNETKKRYVSLSLFRSNQEKYAKLLNAMKMRRSFVETLIKSQMASVVCVNDMLEEILAAEGAQNTSVLPQPAAIGSIQFASSVSPASPSKLTTAATNNPENQFVHILNQFLISALRKLEHDLNEVSGGGGGDDNDGDDLFALKNPISTSFNVNLETYIDLAQRIRAAAKFDASSSTGCDALQNAFGICFDSIKNAIKYVYEQANSVIY